MQFLRTNVCPLCKEIFLCRKPAPSHLMPYHYAIWIIFDSSLSTVPCKLCCSPARPGRISCALLIILYLSRDSLWLLILPWWPPSVVLSCQWASTVVICSLEKTYYRSLKYYIYHIYELVLFKIFIKEVQHFLRQQKKWSERADNFRSVNNLAKYSVLSTIFLCSGVQKVTL